MERQINSSVFERVMIGNVKLSAVPREFNTDITKAFKDSYVLVSEYQTQLPDKKLLQQKLHDIFDEK